MENPFFSEKIKYKIIDIIDFVINNEYSDFYRKKYNNINTKINNYEDFCKLPILKKDELLETDIYSRIFFPEEKIDYLTFTSWTSNNKIPTFIPHINETFEFSSKLTYDEDLFVSYWANRILILYKLWRQLIQLNAMKKEKTFSVPWFVDNMKLSWFVCKQIWINWILSSPTFLLALAEELKKIDFDFWTVKYILLGSEFCSVQKLEYIQNIFPNAFINSKYWNAETWFRWYRCKYLSAKYKPSFYHITKNEFLEIHKPDENWYGKILHTNLVKDMIPLIRYDTWDYGKITSYSCECWEKQLLELWWKSNFDILKFHWVILYSSLISNTLDSIKTYIKPFFQMHVYEREVEWKILPELILFLILNNKDDINKQINLKEFFIENISKNLFLWKKSTLKNLVDKWLFLPLKIEFKDELWIDAYKKTIISHFL